MKRNFFQDSFLISGIMCFDGCGNALQRSLQPCINDAIQAQLLPSDAALIIYAEPADVGIHRLFIYVESERIDFVPPDHLHEALHKKFKEKISFDILDEKQTLAIKKSNKTNWINILINLLTIALIIALSFIFPPSLFMTVGLTVLSFLATAFTGREYFIQFFHNIRKKNLANMSTTITFGWCLSLGHTLFHAISMPFATHFSMIFMNFLMPNILMICINVMDEIKRLILEKSKKQRLYGLQSLFPQMAERYACYSLPQNRSLDTLMTPFITGHYTRAQALEMEQEIEAILNVVPISVQESKHTLREGMLIQVKGDECFPVDCVIVQGNTIIDASLLTGEPQQTKVIGQSVPAGAVNLGQTVTIYAVKNTYNSTINHLLFRSNRAREMPEGTGIPKFAYFYTGLIMVSLLVVIIAPIMLGLSVSLVIQGLIGILFSLCPCTIVLAHYLPTLISVYHRNTKSIHLRDEILSKREDAIHTIVFDKTGTLTTGDATVLTSYQVEASLWQRIYLLEKKHGGAHPLAKAMVRYYEKTTPHGAILLKEVRNEVRDPLHRGLSAEVQGVKIAIGNEAYIRHIDPSMPPTHPSIPFGVSPVFIAENDKYKGMIYIRQEPREGVVEALTRLKNAGVNMIMLTGDNEVSAKEFNKQLGSIFAEKDIYAAQTPADKETFLDTLMSNPNLDPKGYWFIGDGLNDAPCCRTVSEKGGMSCAMDNKDKSAFFTDICLNGSLDYLFQHNKLNRFLRQIIIQNQGILIYSTLALLAFIISFSVVGVALIPLIPMAIMLITTGLVLFNSYRIQLNIDTTLDKKTSWFKKLLASPFSLGLLLATSTMLICSIMVATIATGSVILPVTVFTAGTTLAICSVCSLCAIGLGSVFLLLLVSHFISARFVKTPEREVKTDFFASSSLKPTIRPAEERFEYNPEIQNIHQFVTPEWQPSGESYRSAYL